jgi:hypothetical protein
MFSLREWQTHYKNPHDLIVQASSMDGNDNWQPFPIGMQYNYIHNYKKGPEIQNGNHAKTILSTINIITDKTRRPTGINRECIVHQLHKNGIMNVWLQPNDYFQQLPNYKFIASPEGNGIDCHRHYEALIAGCIPIIEYNPLIEEKYKDCPILYTKDYSEITEDYLLKKYNDMLDITYDFSKLFLTAYTSETQKIIKTCGNYWTTRCANADFYN